SRSDDGTTPARSRPAAQASRRYAILPAVSDSSTDPATCMLEPITRPTPEAPAAVELGALFGRYLPIEELGRGGMGRVLRAYDPRLQREVALKVLTVQAVDPLGWERMVREARSMARLNHPHV